MCDAAASLVTAQTLTQEAITTVTRGDAAGARQIAAQAAAAARGGHDQLQTIEATDVRDSDAWQSLLKAYLHVGQAANALLPEYDGGTATATSELRLAGEAFQSAKASLPAICFTATARSSE